jgi:hypothetical protein
VQPAVPPTPADGSLVASDGRGAETKSTDGFTLSADDTALLGFYFGADVRTLIIKLHDRVLQNPQAKPASLGSVTSEPITDRQLRTQLHKVMKAESLSKTFANAGTPGYASHFQFAT